MHVPCRHRTCRYFQISNGSILRRTRYFPRVGEQLNTSASFQKGSRTCHDQRFLPARERCRIVCNPTPSLDLFLTVYLPVTYGPQHGGPATDIPTRYVYPRVVWRSSCVTYSD